jgi:hypothetical protein
MGRPVNKKYFGSGTGNQIKVRFKTGGTEYNGYVLKQTGSKRYKVSDGTRTITGYLVNKSNSGLANGDIVINVLNDAGAFVQVTKLYNRVAITEDNVKIKWNFTASESDSAVQMQDVEGPTITILTQPIDTLVDLSDSTTDTAVFTINITGVPEADVSYQWQVQEGGTGGWADVSRGSGGTTASYTTGTAQVADSGTADSNGDKYRCIVTATTAGVANSPLTSSAVTLTVQA